MFLSEAGDKAVVNLDLSVHKVRANSKKKGAKYNVKFGQALQWELSTMIEQCILPQVNNSQWLKFLKAMIQTQVMSSFKITIPVLCDYILDRICLLNALPRPLVPLTLCQSSNLSGIKFQPCKSLRSLSHPCPDLSSSSIPLPASPARSPEGFSLCCSGK